MQIRKYSIDLFSEMGLIQHVGSLRLASSEAQLKEIQRNISQAKAIGLECEVIFARRGPQPLPVAVQGEPVRRGLSAARRTPRPLPDDDRPGPPRARDGRLGAHRHAGHRHRGLAAGRHPPRCARTRATSARRSWSTPPACGGPGSAAMAGLHLPTTPSIHQHIALKAVPGTGAAARTPCVRDPGQPGLPAARSWAASSSAAMSSTRSPAGWTACRGSTRKRCPATGASSSPSWKARSAAFRSSTGPRSSPSCATPARTRPTAGRFSARCPASTASGARRFVAQRLRGGRRHGESHGRVDRRGRALARRLGLTRPALRPLLLRSRPTPPNERGEGVSTTTCSATRTTRTSGCARTASARSTTDSGARAPSSARRTAGSASTTSSPASRAAARAPTSGVGVGAPAVLRPGGRGTHVACRERAALLDMTSFGKLNLHSPGALPLLQRLTDNHMDVARPAVYTQFLNSGGNVEGDVTITRLGQTTSVWSPDRASLVRPRLHPDGHPAA